MAIITRDLVPASTIALNDRYERSMTRQYILTADDTDDENAILDSLGYSVNQVHPSYARSLITLISIRCEGRVTPVGQSSQAYFKWVADIQYGPWSPLEHTSTGNPVDVPTKVYFEGQTFQEIADVDVAGNPIVNPAFDPYDPPVMRDKTRVVMTVERNEATFDGSTIAAYSDKTNSDAVGPYPANTLKCSCPTATPMYSQFTGDEYQRVKYVLVYNEDTWNSKPLHQGYNELDPADSTKRRLILIEGVPATSPILLSSAGAALFPPVDHTNVSYGDHPVYEQISFATAFDFPTGTFT